MSTAGKVLIVIVMLLTIAWVLLSAGVSRINTNHNTKVFELTKQVEKLQEEVKDTQEQVESVLIQTQLAQEKIDRERAVLRAKQSDLERARSQVADSLASVKYELEIVEGTAKGAQNDLDHRTTEHEEETKSLAKQQGDVRELMAQCSKQREELAALRKDFLSKYHSNIETRGKVASKPTQSRAGSTN
jgi:predicted  nucleic acid-binding Zn-ribbon protein